MKSLPSKSCHYEHDRCGAATGPNVVTNDTGKPFINGTYWRSSQHFDDGFARYAVPDDTLRDRIERYLLACGVTKEEIAKVRKILLEG